MTYLEPDVRLLGHRLCPICGQPTDDHNGTDCETGSRERASQDESDEQEPSGWVW